MSKPNHIIEIGDSLAIEFGFTAENFDGYLWRDGKRILVSMVIATLFVIAGIPLGGWAIFTMWKWVIVERMGLLPQITMGTALGLQCLIGYLTMHTNTAAREPAADDIEFAVRAFLDTIVLPFVYVGFTWLVLRLFA